MFLTVLELWLPCEQVLLRCVLQVSKQGQPVPAPRSAVPQETNFDVDGHVETVTQRPGGPHAMQARPHDRDMAQGRWVMGGWW